MATSPKALITPDVLVWAREESGYTRLEVAQKIKVDLEKLVSWEQGDKQPSMSQLRKIANIYKRPIGIFFLSTPPDRTIKMHDFRRLSSGDMQGESPQLRLEIRRAYQRRETALDLFEEIEEPPPILDKEIDISDNPEQAAQTIRTWLKLTYAEQISWKNPYKAFNWWRSAIESLGILAFQISGVEVSEMRGFSIHERPLPIIAVNIKDRPRGRIFTMLHELVHILLHEGGICSLHETLLRSNQEQHMEAFCNSVAGAIIVPREYLELESVVTKHSSGPAWSDEELKTLSTRYQASRETILRRLLIIGKTSEDFYQQKREEFIGEYESLEKEQEDQNIVVQPFQKTINSVGTSYTRLLIDGYNRGAINASTLSEALGIRLKHLNKLEQAVFS